jgi:hypothetical protein
MATYLKDRFDSVPDDLLRAGAHRGPKRAGAGWIAFAWAALATGVLVAAGLFGLWTLRGSDSLPFLPQASSSASASPTPSVAPTTTPKLDPKVAISILNGTKTVGLAGATGDYLVKQGWLGAAADIGSRSNADATDVKTTVVYYAAAADEAAARAMIQTLKVGTIQLSTAFPASPITIVIGADFKLP